MSYAVIWLYFSNLIVLFLFSNLDKFPDCKIVQQNN